jgi:hypothetical protein
MPGEQIVQFFSKKGRDAFGAARKARDSPAENPVEEFPFEGPDEIEAMNMRQHFYFWHEQGRPDGADDTCAVMGVNQVGLFRFENADQLPDGRNQPDFFPFFKQVIAGKAVGFHPVGQGGFLLKIDQNKFVLVPAVHSDFFKCEVVVLLIAMRWRQIDDDFFTHCENLI